MMDLPRPRSGHGGTRCAGLDEERLDPRPMDLQHNRWPFSVVCVPVSTGYFLEMHSTQSIKTLTTTTTIMHGPASRIHTAQEREA